MVREKIGYSFEDNLVDFRIKERGNGVLEIYIVIRKRYSKEVQRFRFTGASLKKYLKDKYGYEVVKFLKSTAISNYGRNDGKWVVKIEMSEERIKELDKLAEEIQKKQEEEKAKIQIEEIKRDKREKTKEEKIIPVKRKRKGGRKKKDKDEINSNGGDNDSEKKSEKQV